MTRTLRVDRSAPGGVEDLASHVAAVSAREGWRPAVGMISARWDHLLATRPSALLAAINALPGEAIIAMPSLLIAVNYLRHVLRGDDSGRFHDLPFDAYGRESRTSDLLDVLVAATGRAAGQRTSGRLSLAVESVRTARRLLEEASDRARADVQNALPQLLARWGRTLELADVGGVREYEEAWDLGELTGQVQIARRAAAALAWLHADHGRLSEATIWVERARRTGSRSTRHDAPLHLAAALLSNDRLDPDATDRHLLALAEVPSRDYWAAEVWVRALAAHEPREATQVHGRLHAEKQRHPLSSVQDGANRRYVGAATVRVALLQNSAAPAPLEPTIQTPFDGVMAAAAAYRAGRYRPAIGHAMPVTGEGGNPRLRSEALMLMAAARLGLRRMSSAAVAFSTAHSIIEAEGMYRAYASIDPEHLRALTGLTGLSSAASPDALGRSTSGGQRSNDIGRLTRREREVLALLASDRSFSDIASALYISVNTLKGTTRSLYRKLDVHSRAEAADLADRAGLA
ncbi:response regulator transcription factor [Labedella phragmitis]|uniref:Response regulator transcription factor n=1 Tax=Labedella phragmitis TaxID=2498849 RepID=A0A3S3Z653_9MICO|nr:LuxR C-terminal-related transcriptional regulator [Labedella phragmitis]RWZ52686.1 response regulator transcription factor [Labedella phragmitis]